MISQLGARTRVEPSDIKVVEDSEVRCEVQLTMRQCATVERSCVSGKGRSNATLLADTAMLAPAALGERKRLEVDLPERARKWLASAPARVNSLAAAKDFDFDVKSYAVNRGCDQCAKSGKIPCTQCLRGRIKCPLCHGAKQQLCGVCIGSCSTQCGACGGAGNCRCTYCAGTGEQHCGSCQRSGKVRCYSCGGQGYHRRYQQVQKDIGKGSFYETVEVRDSCGVCHQSGQVSCGSCSGTPTKSCMHCNGGFKSCNACSGAGKVSCTTCGQTGKVTCNACDAYGQTGCTACHATAKVDCQPCGAYGWTHLREDIFTRLADKTSTQWSAATPPSLINRLNRIVTSANAEQEGSFKLQRQQVATDPVTALTRSWKGTVPAWTMRFEVEGKLLTLYAVGESQQLVGLDAAVELILTADREGLPPALKRGGSVARRAVHRYLRSADHVAEVLDSNKQSGGAAREDLQAVSAYLARRADVAEAAWRWSGRAAAAALCVPVLMGIRVRFDLILLLLLPLVIVALFRSAQQRAAKQAVAEASGSTSFAQSWQQIRYRTHPPAAGNKSVLLWGFVLACLTLWLSPAKPLWLAYAASDLRMKTGVIPGMPDLADARTKVLDDWMACRSTNVDQLLTELRTLPTQTPTREFDVWSLQRGIPEKTWNPDGLELAGRKVQQLKVRATVSSGTGTLKWIAFEARMSPIADDPQQLISELDQTSSAAINNMIGTAPDLGRTGEQRSWSALLEKNQGFGKASRKVPSTLVVTCQFRPGDWVRLAR